MYRKKGFTIVELLVVIAIFLIGLALLLPAIRAVMGVSGTQKVQTPNMPVYQAERSPKTTPSVIPIKPESEQSDNRHYVTIQGRKYLILLTDPDNPQIHPCD